jgi:energy-converting hydrogenase A subunit M
MKTTLKASAQFEELLKQECKQLLNLSSDNQEFIDYLTNEIDTESMDLLRELHYEAEREAQKENPKHEIESIDYNDITKNWIVDFINDISYKLEDIKFADDFDANDFYDISHEQADSYTSIYNYDLHKNALHFRDYTDQARAEFGSEETDIIKIYQL